MAESKEKNTFGLDDDQEIIDLLSVSREESYDDFLDELPFFQENENASAVPPKTETQRAATTPLKSTTASPPGHVQRKKTNEHKQSTKSNRWMWYWPVPLIVAVWLIWLLNGAETTIDTGRLYDYETILPQEQIVELLPDEESFETLVVEPQPAQAPLPPPDDQPAEPPKPAKLWYVQSGICSFRSCVDQYKDQLTRIGLPVKVIPGKRRYPFVELYSKQLYEAADAQRFVYAINDNQSKIPNAFSQNVKNKKRVILGLFVTVENAKKIRNYLETVLDSEQIQFKMRKVYKRSQYYIVYAGPYRKKSDAREASKDIREFAGIPDSFLKRF